MTATARAGLEQVLASHFGTRISRMACRPSLYASSFFVNEIDLGLDDGTTVALVAKATRWDARLPEAQQAKPAFLWDDQRERATYESILTQADLQSARYFGSYVDESGVRYLLLERIPGIRLWECADFEPWCEAARWLARLHARVSAESAAASRAAAYLLRYDRDFYESWMTRAAQFHAAHPAFLPGFHPTAHRTRGGDPGLWRLAATHSLVVQRLLDEPPAFLHGEFYSENILVECREHAMTVRPVDWEMAALGPALMDLAHLVAGRWSDDARGRVAEAYFQELAAHGHDTPRREHYLETLDCCLIHLSVQNLGWSNAWTPPPEHAHDWLGEALRLCEKWQI
jgi:Phosphotransferase enzyme family